MTTSITLNSQAIDCLDLTAVQTVIDPWIKTGTIAAHEQELNFQIDYPRDLTDPRELSEIPEVRLWFLRLDAHYPWLPYVLDWDTELARYTAMVVPHQFGLEGIQYNPEALEIFVMHKVFVMMDWMQKQGITSRTKVKFMTKMLGYELDDGFFDLVGF
ncbi:MAG: CRR6 family NdhI maturation factor [Leptolyngbyaceae cyanobacterium CRU_2_3]|nr:CRR6 family NdhI maturation factor [Leptolyngbyaceae cyanobacterium CRU_2_3]